jgi:hypothetical protein
MRLPPAAVPVVAVLLAIAGGASAGPRGPRLGRLSADGPVTLASSRAGQALLQADRIKPGDSVSGTVSLTNTGDRAGTLDLGVTGLQDRPGSRGGRLSSVLRLRVEDLAGGRPPLESVVGRLPTFALGPLQGGETRAYRVTAIFPDTGVPPGPFAGDNLEQGSSVEVAMAWQLTAADPAPAATPVAPAPPATRPAPPPAAAPAAVLTLRVPRQRMHGRRGLVAFVECSVACQVRFTARTDTAPRGGRRPRALQSRHVLRGDRRWHALRAGQERRVFLTLRAKARARVRRQLRRHGRAAITIKAQMRSAAGNRVVRRRIVMNTDTRGARRAAAPRG